MPANKEIIKAVMISNNMDTSLLLPEWGATTRELYHIFLRVPTDRGKSFTGNIAIEIRICHNANRQNEMSTRYTPNESPVAATTGDSSQFWAEQTKASCCRLFRLTICRCNRQLHLPARKVRIRWGRYIRWSISATNAGRTIIRPTSGSGIYRPEPAGSRVTQIA